MRFVLQNNLRLIGALIAGRYLDVLRVLDDMIVGDDAAVFGEDEPGTLAVLRYHPIKKSKARAEEVTFTTDGKARL